jgi:hypothetical protein
VLVDALYVRVRRHGAVRSTAVLLAVGINEEGQREILGLDVACGETRDTWQDFFRSLRARGLWRWPIARGRGLRHERRTRGLAPGAGAYLSGCGKAM